jgi:hypothetical protein
MLKCFSMLALALMFVGPMGAAHAQPECPYPAATINWIMRYCSFVVGTDDEIAVQDSACFEEASKDLGKPDVCALKRKYKESFCRERMKDTAKYKSILECIEDDAISPFFAGE